METNLWEVKISYAFMHGGMTYKSSFYVGAGNIVTATALAVEFLDKMSHFDKHVLSITDTGSTLFQKQC